MRTQNQLECMVQFFACPFPVSSTELFYPYVHDSIGICHLSFYLFVHHFGKFAQVNIVAYVLYHACIVDVTTKSMTIWLMIMADHNSVYE